MEMAKGFAETEGTTLPKGTRMVAMTEIFVLKMKDPERADAIRERARADFLSIEGVESWKTYVTIHPDKPTLYSEIFTFPDLEVARKITPLFSEREATKAFLEEIEEIVVGQYFIEHKPKGEAA